MPAIRQQSKDNIIWTAKKASTAISNNAVLTYDSSTGTVQPAVTASTNLAGVSRKVVASTDTDYASTTLIPMDVPAPNDLYVLDCNTTVTQAMVGDDFDLASSVLLDNSAAGTVKHVKLVGGVGTTKAVVRFNPVVLFQTSAT